MSFIAATTASVEMPASTPFGTGASPSTRPSRMPTNTAAPTFAAKSAPPFFTMYGVALNSMVEPMHT